MGYEPNAAWFEALAEKVCAYRAARTAKQYELSDKLRAELTNNGVIDLDTNPQWHPVFESSCSRSARL